MAKKITFDTGDVVKLVSEGPDMTVVKYSDPTYLSVRGTYDCIWFCRDGTLHEGEFDENIVKLVKKSNISAKEKPKDNEETKEKKLVAEAEMPVILSKPFANFNSESKGKTRNRSKTRN